MRKLFILFLVLMLSASCASAGATYFIGESHYSGNNVSLDTGAIAITENDADKNNLAINGFDLIDNGFYIENNYGSSTDINARVKQAVWTTKSGTLNTGWNLVTLSNPDVAFTQYDIDSSTNTDFSYYFDISHTENINDITKTQSGNYYYVNMTHDPVFDSQSGNITCYDDTLLTFEIIGQPTCVIDSVSHDVTVTGNKIFVDTGDYSTSSHNINITIPLYPTLISPADGSNTTGTFPPLAQDVDFEWAGNAENWKYQISRDQNFNIIAAEGYTSNDQITISLTNDDYWWRVFGYDAETEELTNNSSEVWTYTLDLTAPGITETAIDGIAYESTESGDQPISGALVTIWNSTWTDNMIVSDNGYFLFDDLAAGETYSLQATKQRYSDSSVELVTTVSGQSTTKNILLQSSTGRGEQYIDHYVSFTVQAIWGTTYSGVDVKAYEDGDVVPTYTGTTGTDGSIAFIMNEDTEYRLTFIDLDQGINEEIYIYPKEDQYNVYVFKSLQDYTSDEPMEVEEIDISLSTSQINSTHAYINVTYLDNLAATTSLNLYLNQSDQTDPLVQTTVDSASLGAVNNTTYSFTVSDYEAESYFVIVVANHDTFGSMERTYAVHFDGMQEDFGFDSIWIYISIGSIVFLGSVFGEAKAEKGAMIVCGLAWVFVGLGWFAPYDTLGMKAGLTMATIMAIAANMAKRDREGI